MFTSAQRTYSSKTITNCINYIAIFITDNSYGVYTLAFFNSALHLARMPFNFLYSIYNTLNMTIFKQRICLSVYSLKIVVWTTIHCLSMNISKLMAALFIRSSMGFQPSGCSDHSPSGTTSINLLIINRL